MLQFHHKATKNTKQETAKNATGRQGKNFGCSGLFI